jgi:hypothetical protein
MRRQVVLACSSGLLLIAGFAGEVAHAANQPPVARFTVSPGSGTVERTFQVDASASTDDKTPVSKLKVRWDWENDGVWDTAYATVKTASHGYPSEGNRTIRLQVLDGNSATGTTTHAVAVVPPAITQRLISSEGREPDVDVNPTDAANIVVSVATGSGGGIIIPYPAYASLDGGNSWTRSLGQESNRGADPGFEFLPDGRAVLMSLDDTACDGNLQGLQMDISTDKGLNFTRAGYAFDENTLFLLPNGSSRAACGRRAVFPCTSGFDDLLFDYPKIAADKGPASPHAGNLYAIAHNVHFDQDGDGTCDSVYLAFARSTNGGASWGSSQALPVASFTSALGIGADGAVYYASVTSESTCPPGNGIRLRKSTDGGATFGAGSCAYDASGGLTPIRTWTAADPANASRVYVLFDAGVPSLGGSVHIYAISSTNGGATWSAPVRVDDVMPDDAVDHARPTLSVSANGRLDAAWFDYRNSSPTRLQTPGQDGDIYYAYSEDGGVTWSRNLRLTPSSAPAEYGAHNDFLTISSQGSRAYAAYAMSPGGGFNYQAYLGIVDFN